MNENQFRLRSKNLLNRMNALGFTCNGKAPVIDQVFELVAAEDGFRNQHVLRAELKKPKPASQGPWTFGDGVVCSTQEELDAYLEGVNPPSERVQKLENALRTMVEQADEDCPSEYRSKHFHIAMSEARGLLGHTTAPATAPVTAMAQAIAELESRWGAEHDFYDRHDWRNDASRGDTNLGYWEWVQHNIESHGGEECHCTECGCPDADDGEGENGLCGNCADRAYNEAIEFTGSAKHLSKHHTHSNKDDSSTLKSLYIGNAEYELRVCGNGKTAYFEWIDGKGDPVGGPFNELTEDAVKTFKELLKSKGISVH